jgi:diguanylate cyclase
MLTATALAFLVIGLLAGYGVASRIPQASPPPPSPQEPQKTDIAQPVAPQVTVSSPSVNSKPLTLKDPVLDEITIVLLGLLNTLNTAIESLQSGSDEYATKLESHRNKLKQTLTVTDLQRLGAEMVHQIEVMYASNKQYRDKLENANTLVGQQQQELEKLQLRTGTDFLTNISNRASYDDRLKEMTNIARRYGNVFSLILMDIDNFKQINDTYGHSAGDTILRNIAKLLSECSRASDFLARYGGEEFIYILPETNQDQALVQGNKLRKLVEESTFSYNGTGIPVTISGGIGTIKKGKESGEELFARTDAALYRAKEKGRNRIESEEG